MTRERKSDRPERSDALKAELLDALRQLKAGYPADTRNPIDGLANVLLDDIHAGKLTRSDLEGVVAHLTVDAVHHRARRLADYFNTCDQDAMAGQLRRALYAVAKTDEAAQPLSFEAFKQEVEREILGIVITAHPTFGMSEALTQTIARLACRGENIATEDVRAMIAADAGLPEHLDLAFEHRFAATVIANIQAALERAYAIVFEVAADLYPDRWRELTPRLASIATWVGYDLDGRHDISWKDTMRVRLDEKAHQLSSYAARLDHPRSDNRDAGDATGLFGRLHHAAKVTAEDGAALPDNAADWAGTRKFNRHIAAADSRRITDPRELVATLTQQIQDAHPDMAKELALFRAAVTNYGLGTAHIHMRINATQLINAIRGDVGLESAPDETGNRRRYLAVLNRCLDTVTPVSVNFGSLVAETMSARRAFMLVAQILKHVDQETPIRFLIAEADTTFTVLGALYLARLFGIDERLDISPLFETPDAFERGHEVVSELLDNEHFQAYVRRRGRLCIQTGFSDGGRYIGQVAVALAVERLHVKLMNVLAEKGMAGKIELVIFDTHGESIGRGRHPRSFAESLDYVYTPLSRESGACSGIEVKHELSFQGADGYVYFATPEIAFASVSALLAQALQPSHDPCKGLSNIRESDRLYGYPDYSLDFFLSAKTFNEALIENRDYGALLRPGENLLFTTGSRPVSRQHKGGVAPRPLDIRAIPHNGILQQYGFLANSLGGVGTAIMKDFDRFADTIASSKRFQSLIALAAGALTLSDLAALGAYIELFNPLAWLDHARRETDERRSHALQRLSGLLAESGLHEGLARVVRLLMDDGINLEKALVALPGSDGLVPESLHACRDDLALLHAIRIALLKEILLLGARLPRFTPEEDVTIEEVIREILQFNVPAALEILEKAFPAPDRQRRDTAFGEPATYQPGFERSYEREHRELFRPLRELYGLNQRISVAISHFMGAVG